jgi:S-adenosylmethionine:tRNA ribosyltransferase-isomerase
MENSLDKFDYHLPADLIAQAPLPERDASRMLIMERASGRCRHAGFCELPSCLDPGDVVVVNDTRVFPARLLGTKASGGRVELFLVRPPVIKLNGTVPQVARGFGWLRASKKPQPGQRLHLGPDLQAEVVSLGPQGEVEFNFWTENQDIRQALQDSGHTPLPPYIHRPAGPEDAERYQTVFASHPGAVAAPTAGLHFSPAVIRTLQARGVVVTNLTLHVGPGTFQPVRVQDYTQHRLTPEYYLISRQTADLINQARGRGKRILAVGTTTVRVLEFQGKTGRVEPGEGYCDLFIYPGYNFQVVDRLLTNFHLPQSTLLLLVSAFAGREKVLPAYEEAVQQRYRFYSYGDCMLIR